MPVGVGGGNDRRSVTRSPLLAVILSVGVLGILAVIFGGPARMQRAELLKGDGLKAAAQQRLLEKELLAAHKRMDLIRFARDPDDNIKVLDTRATKPDNFAHIFGLGPFGQDGMGLAAKPLREPSQPLHIALVNHLLPRS